MKNQNKIHSLLEVASIIFVLLFTSVGCERKPGKLPEPAILTESAEQTQSLNKAAPTGAEAEELGVIIERNVPVPMRDGTILRADVHRPDRGGPYPVLVRRTPYGKGGNFNQLVKAGYIVVSQDARGRYESEGEFESMGGPKTHDAEDGYDTIKWEIPNGNGSL